MATASTVASTHTQALATSTTPGIRRRWLDSLIAGATANMALWILITQVLSTPLVTKEELAIGGYEVQIPLVLITTFVATSVGAIGRGIAGKILPAPRMAWAAVTSIAGLASFAGPATSAADGTVQLGLTAMHVATTLVVLISHLRPTPELA